jgi:hypothetical protein
MWIGAAIRQQQLKGKLCCPSAPFCRIASCLDVADVFALTDSDLHLDGI